MGLSSSIQFRDAQSVIDAFNDRGIEAWSISCGKQFMFKGIGSETFESTIKLLNNGDSNATYTVQVYEDIENEKNIKNTTPCDGSFNFKLNEALHQMYGVLKPAVGSNPNDIISKLNGIEQRLNEMEAAPETNDNSLGMIGRILEHPALSAIAPKIIENVLGAILGTPAAVSGGPAPLPPYNIEPGQDLEGAKNLMSKLKTHDPNLEKHLAKLLMVAETEPATFQNIVNAFN